MRRLVEHALRAVFPSSAGIPGLDRLDFGARLDEVRRGPPMLRLGLYAATVLFVLLPVWTVFTPLPSFWLSPARLELHANRLAGSRIYLLRQIMLLLKTVGGLLWGADPEVRQALGLSPLGPDPGTFRGDQSRAPAGAPAGAS